MSLKTTISRIFLSAALFSPTAWASNSVAVTTPGTVDTPTISSGTINVINENFKDLVVSITGQGNTTNGKPPITYTQKIGAGEETKFNIQYLNGAQFYSINGVLVKGSTVPFTTSTCTNLNVDQHYKVTFTKVDDVVTHCKAELLNESGQVVQ